MAILSVGNRGRVNGSNVNVRTGPGTNNSRLYYAQTGDIVVVLGGSYDSASAWWLQIRNETRNTTTVGWIHNDYVDPYSTGGGTGSWETRWTNTPGETVDIRNGPGTNYTIVNQYPHGTKVQVNAPSSTWSQVRRYGNTTVAGYMMTDFLVMADPNGGSGGGGNTGGSGTYTTGHYGRLTAVAYVRPNAMKENTNNGTFPIGSTFVIRGTEMGQNVDGSALWVKIYFGNDLGANLTRYVHSSCIEDIGPSDPTAKARAITIAQSLVGATGANLGLSGDWCQNFLYWLCGTSGLQVASMPYGEGYCGVARDWLVNVAHRPRHEQTSPATYIPQPGDFVYYEAGGTASSHVGLVIRGDSTSYTAYEGNLSDKVKRATGNVAIGTCDNNKMVQCYVTPSWGVII